MLHYKNTCLETTKPYQIKHMKIKAYKNANPKKPFLAKTKRLNKLIYWNCKTAHKITDLTNATIVKNGTLHQSNLSLAELKFCNTSEAERARL